MKAAVMRKWGKINIEDIPIPEIGPEEVLIKVKYGGLCGSDLHVYSGHHPTAKLPLILGHEFSGELIKISTNNPHIDLKIGDKVVAQPYTSCKICDACVSGRDNVCSQLKVYGVHDHGCFAEYVKIPVNKIYKIPEGFDMKLAALAEPLAVAVHDVRQSDLRVGQRALILGGGPIGILIAIIARLNGASEVVISEINKNRIKFAKSLGFDVVNPLDENFKEQLNNITNNEGFDVVFEVTGVAPSLKSMTNFCKIGGTIMLVGIPKEINPVNTIEGVLKEINIKGVRVHSQYNFKSALNILKKGTINDELNKLITHEFSLDEFEKAIDFSINDDNHFKVMIKID